MANVGKRVVLVSRDFSGPERARIWAMSKAEKLGKLKIVKHWHNGARVFIVAQPFNPNNPIHRQKEELSKELRSEERFILSVTSKSLIAV